MRRLLSPTDGVQARRNHVLRPPALDEIVVHCMHEEALRCLLVVVSEPERASELRDVPLTIGECDLARFLAKTEAAAGEPRC
jgi:hypothetical protein